MVLPIGFAVTRGQLSGGGSWYLSTDSSDSLGLFQPFYRGSMGYDPVDDGLLFIADATLNPSNNNGPLTHHMEIASDGTINWSNYVSYSSSGANYNFGTYPITPLSTGKWAIFNQYAGVALTFDIGTGNNVGRDTFNFALTNNPSTFGHNGTATTRANRFCMYFQESINIPWHAGYAEYDVSANNGTTKSYIGQQNVLTSSSSSGILHDSANSRWVHIAQGYKWSGGSGKWTNVLSQDNVASRVSSANITNYTGSDMGTGHYTYRPVYGPNGQLKTMKDGNLCTLISPDFTTRDLTFSSAFTFAAFWVAYSPGSGNYYVGGDDTSGNAIIVRLSSSFSKISAFTITGGGTDAINRMGTLVATKDGIAFSLSRGTNKNAGFFVCRVFDDDFDNLAGSYGSGNDAITFTSSNITVSSATSSLSTSAVSPSSATFGSNNVQSQNVEYQNPTFTSFTPSDVSLNSF